MIKKLSVYISLLVILNCAKDTSEDDSSVYVLPPSNTINTGSPSTTVTQYTLTVSAGEGGVCLPLEVHIMMAHQLVL